VRRRIAGLTLTLTLTLAMLVAGAACSGGNGGRDVVRPGSVPTQAGLVDGEFSFGTADADAVDPPDERLLSGLGCAENLLSLVTTREAVYAELPCDRFVDASVVARFQGTRVRVTVCVPDSDCARARQSEDEGKLLVESPTGGSIEFTTGHIWIEER
jgi:hypothetical protein